MIKITEKNDSIIFSVRVVPRASKTEIVGVLSGALKVRVASPPVDGAANSELIKFLAKTLEISKSEIEIIGGRASKSKQIKITGLSAGKFLQFSGLK